MTLGTLSPFARLLAAALESAGWSARPGTLSWVHPCGLTLELECSNWAARLTLDGTPPPGRLDSWRLSSRKLSSESAGADVARQAADCVNAVLLLDARQIAAQGD